MTTPPVLERIRSRGYWDVRVMPSEFKPDRMPRLADVERAFSESHVQLRGWDYPHEPREGTTRGPDYIEGTVDWQHYHELWRLYKSGQFVHIFSLREDWYKESELARMDLDPGSILELRSTLYTITEIFLFAARLAEKVPLGPMVSVRLKLHGLANRRLQTLDPGRMPPNEFRRAGPSVNDFSGEVQVNASELIARAPEMAVDQTMAIYELFNWDPAKQVVVEDQRRFLERRV